MSADSRLTAALAALDAAREVLAVALDDDRPEAAAPSPTLVLTFEETKAELSVSRTAVFELVKNGALAVVEIPGAGRRIRRCDLEAYVKSLSPAW